MIVDNIFRKDDRHPLNAGALRGQRQLVQPLPDPGLVSEFQRRELSLPAYRSLPAHSLSWRRVRTSVTLSQ